MSSTALSSWIGLPSEIPATGVLSGHRPGLHSFESILRLSLDCSLSLSRTHDCYCAQLRPLCVVFCCVFTFYASMPCSDSQGAMRRTFPITATVPAHLEKAQS